MPPIDNPIRRAYDSTAFEFCKGELPNRRLRIQLQSFGTTEWIS